MMLMGSRTTQTPTPRPVKFSARTDSAASAPEKIIDEDACEPAEYWKTIFAHNFWRKFDFLVYWSFLETDKSPSGTIAAQHTK